VFGTLPGGLGELPGAVAAAAGAQVRLGLPARRVERVPGGFRVVAGPVPAPVVLDADAVVVAVPASKAAPLLADLAPAVSGELAGIEYASMAIVTLGYRAAEVPPLVGSGLLVPAVEGGAVKAVTYSSAKWPHLAGHELTVLRASIGRYGEERVLQRSDEELVTLAATEVGALAGLPARAVAARVSRWGGALPQYGVGHLDRVGRIRGGVAAVPGLAVCGAAYEGVGVPACIRSGYAAAASVLGHLAQQPGYVRG
jgi:oxygen-dependent protoporphyrinogen oxidase